MSFEFLFHRGFCLSFGVTHLRHGVVRSFWAATSFPVHFKIRHIVPLNAPVNPDVLKFAPARSAASRIALARARDAVYPTLGAGNASIPSPKSESAKITAPAASSGAQLKHLTWGRGVRAGEDSLSVSQYRPGNQTTAPHVRHFPVTPVRPFFTPLSAEPAAA